MTMGSSSVLRLPESPRFLVRHGKLEEARQVLGFIREKNEVDAELRDILLHSVDCGTGYGAGRRICHLWLHLPVRRSLYPELCTGNAWCNARRN